MMLAGLGEDQLVPEMLAEHVFCFIKVYFRFRRDAAKIG